MAETTVRQKAKILTFLRSAKKVSGELIADHLGVSRTYVWKQIKSLQAGGYLIKATSNGGYQLLESPDTVADYAILSFLPPDYPGAVLSYETTNSTNDVAKDLALKGLQEGTLVVAEKQHKGRGRLGHSWSSPPGGIWFSLLLRPSLPVRTAPRFAIWTAVAVAQTVKELTGLALQIKWPNDLMIGGRKAGGILVEMAAEIGCIDYLVIGVGLNANFKVEQLPPELQTSATTLLDCLGWKVNRAQLIAALAANFISSYKQVEHNFAEVLEHFQQLSETLNKQIQLKATAKVYQGKAIAIDSQGALVVKLNNGQTKHFQAGEVTVLKD